MREGWGLAILEPSCVCSEHKEATVYPLVLQRSDTVKITTSVATASLNH